MESIHINNWLNKMKHKYITIKDIEKLNKGDCIKLLAIDRNFYDLINNNEIDIINKETLNITSIEIFDINDNYMLVSNGKNHVILIKKNIKRK